MSEMTATRIRSRHSLALAAVLLAAAAVWAVAVALLWQTEIPSALQLPKVDPKGENFKAKMTVLKELVEHHVQEEEGEIFKKLTQPDVDWNSVLEEMQQQRMQLMEEKGLPAESEAEQETSSRSQRA